MRSFAVVLAFLLASTLMTASAFAKPLDPVLQKQLLDLYDRYNKAIAAGQLEEALKTRSAQTREQLQKEFGDKERLPEMLEFAKQMVPDGLEVVHTNLSADGIRASILSIASKRMPEDVRIPNGPPPGSTVRSELTLEFVKENGAWTYDSQTFGIDPDKIVACKDETFESIEAYDQDQTTSMGGPIARVAFNPDYTLVVVRVLDEENCAYLPNKATLEEKGFDTTLLVPYAIVEIEGYQHKTDKQKIWIDSLTARPE
jgi:hypothetical protein